MRKLLFAALLLALSTGPAIAQQKVDSLQWYRLKCDTLMHEKYTAAKKYAVLKGYVKVVINHPKNAVFLKSWLRNVDAIKE